MNELLLTKLKEVNEEVDRLLSTSPSIIRKYLVHLSLSKGKGVRALSVLASALDKNDEIHPDAIYMASGIELLHLATLVHDDVMDDADTRRGIATLHSKYGRKTAVICGDYLLALAMNQMNAVDDKNQYVDFNFADIMLDIALGELQQHINNGNKNLSIKEYLDIIDGKTAKLFEASFYAGCITHSSDEAIINAYREIGHLLGMMFQITDDCLDFEATESETLKPVQSDYEQGVMTLPLLYAFQEDPTLKEKNLTRDFINEVVAKFDGVGFAKRKVNNYYEQAMSLIDSLDMSELKKDSFTKILEMARR